MQIRLDLCAWEDFLEWHSNRLVMIQRRTTVMYIHISILRVREDNGAEVLKHLVHFDSASDYG